MSSKNPFRLLSIVVAFVIASALPASAAPVTVGLFGWQFDAGGVDLTLGLEIFGSDWPGALVLDDVVVDFTRSNGSSGQAFFAFDPATNAGQGISIDAAAGSLQIQGLDGRPFEPLPQDIVAATLRFSFDEALGSVFVDTLGPQFDLSGVPTFDIREIVFDAATTPVPEPSTLMLFGSTLAGLVLIRRRRGSRA
jgi:hypothetical protein